MCAETLPLNTKAFSVDSVHLCELNYYFIQLCLILLFVLQVCSLLFRDASSQLDSDGMNASLPALVCDSDEDEGEEEASRASSCHHR